jgi:hypothetical protein
MASVRRDYGDGISATVGECAEHFHPAGAAEPEDYHRSNACSICGNRHEGGPAGCHFLVNGPLPKERWVIKNPSLTKHVEGVFIGGCVARKNMPDELAHAHVGDGHFQGWICFKRDQYVGLRELWLHEIAHLLTPQEGHGAVWKRMTNRIGGTLDPVLAGGWPITRSYQRPRGNPRKLTFIYNGPSGELSVFHQHSIVLALNRFGGAMLGYTGGTDVPEPLLRQARSIQDFLRRKLETDFPNAPGGQLKIEVEEALGRGAYEANESVQLKHPRCEDASAEYAYHATGHDRLPQIRARGLVPGASSAYGDRYSEFDDGKHLFFADSFEWVQGMNDVVLRFPRPTSARPDINTYGRMIPHAFVTKETVPASSIEVFDRSLGAWLPLCDRGASEATAEELGAPLQPRERVRRKGLWNLGTVTDVLPVGHGAIVRVRWDNGHAASLPSTDLIRVPDSPDEDEDDVEASPESGVAVYHPDRSWAVVRGGMHVVGQYKTQREASTEARVRRDGGAQDIALAKVLPSGHLKIMAGEREGVGA